MQIQDGFEAWAGAFPRKVALIHEDLTLSYGELNAQANRLAHFLRTCGVGPDKRVGVCMERSFEMVIALLAVIKSGGAYVPLDPSYPIERLRYVIQDSCPIVTLSRGLAVPLISELLRVPPMQHFDVERDAALWKGERSSDPEPVELDGVNLAYVIYTSGSTGRPKGVMVEHKSVLNRLAWMQASFSLTQDDVVLQKTPFFFDVSVWEFFWPLLNGATLLIAEVGGHMDPMYLGEVISSENVTIIHFVPSMMQAFVSDCDIATCCRSLRHVICSGEALSGAVARRFKEAVPHVNLHNLYGPTEGTVDVTAWSANTEPIPDNVPIGHPIANTSIYILDERNERLSNGAAGELHIGGVQVARGYINRSRQTAERFIPDPFSRELGARMYKTGDLARLLPDGNIEFLGRLDFQVKIRGFRIELGEIEARLLEHPAIAQAVVIAREVASEPRLIAYYVPRNNVDFDLCDLREHLETLLPRYMVPTIYVPLASLPVTSNGKLDRNALPTPSSTCLLG